MERLQGVVVWFNNAKGYGFLSRPDGPDVFCHFSSIITDGYKTLKQGEPVEYRVIQGDKGPQADDVHRTGGSASDATEATPSAAFADITPVAETSIAAEA